MPKGKSMFPAGAEFHTFTCPCGFYCEVGAKRVLVIKIKLHKKICDIAKNCDTVISGGLSQLPCESLIQMEKRIDKETGDFINLIYKS